ncbi:MAG TPA: helix-turn-helix domain-containing protein [Streptosporangiaceae bacterium]|nr:helix-turn-helix domain-containing protein [Streptosporangiaceae bacterium]
MAADRSSTHSLTLERGLRVLSVLAQRPDGLTVSELAKAMRTHRAGTYRLLGPLADQRLVTRAPGGRYVLGLGLVELASRVRPRLQEAAVPVLRELADQIRATTALTVRDGDEAVVLTVLEPRNTRVHLAYRPGIRHPVTVAAPGIALLASGPPQPGERPAVAEARRRGWAASSSELLQGATGIGAAIRTSADPADAAISAVWVDGRDPATAAGPLLTAARRIAAALR